MLLFALLYLACAAFLPGCQLLGVAAYKLSGPAAVPAQYKPAKTPLLVLVENYQHQSSVNTHADLLARHIVRQLDANNVAPMVSLDRLQELRDDRAKDFPKLSITAIGQAVGAKQVLYVQLKSSDVTPIAGGEGFSGETTALVKFVDVTTGATLWPTDMTDGRLMGASAKIGSSSGADPMSVRQRMSLQLADQIAKLFYKWKPDEDTPEGFTQ